MRKALTELQRRGSQRPTAGSLARWLSQQESPQLVGQQQAHILQVVHACTSGDGNSSLAALLYSPGYSLQALAPSAHFSNRASWSYQHAGFSAQAQQEQPSPSDASPEINAEAESPESNSETGVDTNAYDDLEPEELRVHLLEKDAALAAQSAEASNCFTSTQNP